jgi:DNA-binding NtrC family response regulator
MSKLKILIVDDEEELVFTLSERLQFRNFDADAAINSGDALRLVHEKKYDVAIIDLKMPVVGGMELMKMIHHISPETKVILMTGHCSEEEGKAGISKGAYDYLIKPVSINVLIEKIQGCCKANNKEDGND